MTSLEHLESPQACLGSNFSEFASSGNPTSLKLDCSLEAAFSSSGSLDSGHAPSPSSPRAYTPTFPSATTPADSPSSNEKLCSSLEELKSSDVFTEELQHYTPTFPSTTTPSDSPAPNVKPGELGSSFEELDKISSTSANIDEVMNISNYDNVYEPQKKVDDNCKSPEDGFTEELQKFPENVPNFTENSDLPKLTELQPTSGACPLQGQLSPPAPATPNSLYCQGLTDKWPTPGSNILVYNEDFADKSVSLCPDVTLKPSTNNSSALLLCNQDTCDRSVSLYSDVTSPETTTSSEELVSLYPDVTSHKTDVTEYTNGIPSLYSDVTSPETITSNEDFFSDIFTGLLSSIEDLPGSLDEDYLYKRSLSRDSGHPVSPLARSDSMGSTASRKSDRSNVSGTSSASIKSSEVVKSASNDGKVTAGDMVQYSASNVGKVTVEGFRFPENTNKIAYSSGNIHEVVKISNYDMKNKSNEHVMVNNYDLKNNANQHQKKVDVNCKAEEVLEDILDPICPILYSPCNKTPEVARKFGVASTVTGLTSSNSSIASSCSPYSLNITPVTVQPRKSREEIEASIAHSESLKSSDDDWIMIFERLLNNPTGETPKRHTCEAKPRVDTGLPKWRVDQIAARIDRKASERIRGSSVSSNENDRSYDRSSASGIRGVSKPSSYQEVKATYRGFVYDEGIYN